MNTNLFSSFCVKTLAVMLVFFFIGSFSLAARSQKNSVAGPVVKVTQKYKDRDGVESISLGSFLIGIARMATSDEDGGEILKYLDRMVVFSADDASEALKADIRADLDAALKNYETVMQMKDGEDDMSVYFNMPTEDLVKEMVMVSNSELAVIIMIGDMPVSVLEKMASEATVDVTVQ